MPALPLDEAGKYVAGAYVVFVVLILVYVAIMAAKLQRIERELRELAGFAEQRKNGSETTAPIDTANRDRPGARGREAEQAPLEDAEAVAEETRR